MSITLSLPQRKTERPITTGDNIHHIQKIQLCSQNFTDDLCNWTFSSISDITEEKSVVSFPTSKALWLNNYILQSHENSFSPKNSRKFANIHEDGSMHLSLSDESSKELINKGWNEPHPLQKRGENAWIVYSPRDSEELKICKKILADSYFYASGKKIKVE